MSSHRRIYLDVSSTSVVVKCVECPWWFAFRFTREEGWRAARDHELAAHPGATQATTALHRYREVTG